MENPEELESVACQVLEEQTHKKTATEPREPGLHEQGLGSTARDTEEDGSLLCHCDGTICA
jgi:hypothetical protein